MFDWLFRLFGYRKHHEFTDEDREWAEILKQLKRSNQLAAMQGTKGRGNSILDLREQIEATRDIAEEMGWVSEDDENSGLEKQLTEAVMKRFMPQPEKSLSDTENVSQLQQVADAVRSGKLKKREFLSLAGKYFEQEKSLKRSSANK